MISARPKRVSARIANGNSKYGGANSHAYLEERDRILKEIQSKDDYLLEYESPKNRRGSRSLANPEPARPVRRTMSNSSLATTESDEPAPAPIDVISNPMDVISAAATTVEYCEQIRNVELLEHQCMVVQQEFDDMMAEKEDIIDQEKKKRDAAEKRANDAEAMLQNLRNEILGLKVKMFEIKAESKAMEAKLAQFKLAPARVLVGTQSSRKRRKAPTEVAPPVSAPLTKRKRLRYKRGSF